MVPLTLASIGCENLCDSGDCGTVLHACRALWIPNTSLLSAIESTDTMAVWGESNPDARWTLGMGYGYIILGDSHSESVRLFPLVPGAEVNSEDGHTSIEGLSGGEEFGSAVAILPDRDNSGQPELLIGAPGYRTDFGRRSDGAVYLVSDFPSEGDEIVVTEEQRVLEGSSIGSRLGSTIAICSDMDGDMMEEWAVAAPQDNSGEVLAGSVTLMLSSLASGSASSDDRATHRWTGSIRGELAGQSLHCTHDLTGDGVPDLAVGAPFSDGNADGTGRIYVISGGAIPPNGSLEDASSRTLSGLVQDAWTGWSIATGDMNGDGRAEIAAGSPGMDDSRGWVLVWDGADIAQRGELYPDYRIAGALEGDRFGHRIVLADIDDDDLADLLVSAAREEASTEEASRAPGRLYLFQGRDAWSDWRPQMDVTDADNSHLPTETDLQGPLEMIPGDIDDNDEPELLVLELSPEASR